MAAIIGTSDIVNYKHHSFDFPVFALNCQHQPYRPWGASVRWGSRCRQYIRRDRMTVSPPEWSVHSSREKPCTNKLLCWKISSRLSDEIKMYFVHQNILCKSKCTLYSVLWPKRHLQIHSRKSIHFVQLTLNRLHTAAWQSDTLDVSGMQTLSTRELKQKQTHKLDQPL